MGDTDKCNYMSVDRRIKCESAFVEKKKELSPTLETVDFNMDGDECNTGFTLLLNYNGRQKC